MKKMTAIAASAGMVLASVAGVGALALRTEPAPPVTQQPAITIEYVDANGDRISIEPTMAPAATLPSELLSPPANDQMIALDTGRNLSPKNEQAEHERSDEDHHEDEDDDRDDDDEEHDDD